MGRVCQGHERVLSKLETHKPHRISEAFGRRQGSSFQHLCVNAHNPSSRAGCTGRCGRSPAAMAITTSWVGLSPNGTSTVKAFVRMNQSQSDSGRVGCLIQTSMTTIANENTSDSLLWEPLSVKTSGAVHRDLSHWPAKAGDMSCVIAARPISVIRAQPAGFTRMFNWLGVNTSTKQSSRTIRTPLRFP